MRTADAQSSRLFTRLAGVLALLLAVGPGLGTFALGYSSLASALETYAQVKAESINQAISLQPELWRYQEHRLNELMERVPRLPSGAHARIHGDDGSMVAATRAPVPAFALVRTAPLFDGGVAVGQVAVHQSVQGLLAGTTLATLLGLLLSGGVVLGLRRVRRREQATAESLFQQQRRAWVTLRSIGDAVITTDAQGRVDYLNPVAERLTQWPLDEACGRHLNEVCALVDEHTRAALPGVWPWSAGVAGPAAHGAPGLPDPTGALVGGAELTAAQDPGNGDCAVALLRRDGRTLAIAHSAAPLHDSAGQVVGGAVVFHDVTEVRRLSRRLSWAAAHDPLTGLVNRGEFEQRVAAALRSAHSGGGQHAVCYLDLDQFKLVNDTCGHAAGDRLLKQLSALMLPGLREADTLARLGGDEFGLLLQGCAIPDAERIAGEVLEAIRGLRFHDSGKVFSTSASIGLVALDADTGDLAEVFAAADTACYQAKEQGRNRVCVYRRSDADLAQRRSDMGWAARLQAALHEGRLKLYYQRYLPLGAAPVGASTGAERRADLGADAGAAASGETSVEILLRLVDEAGQVVAPGAFLPAAERYNLMPAIDRWVIAEVLARYADLARQMGPGLSCAINLSGTSLNSEGLLDHIRHHLQLHRPPPGAICFEITETAVINNLQHAARFMAEVKALGCRFALDDFGVGASSLTYLKSLPVDVLKIDGSFVRHICSDPVDRAMAEMINRVGHIMGLKTVAEFAETAEVIAALRGLGIDYAQGYGVHRPEPLPLPLPRRMPRQPLPAGTTRAPGVPALACEGTPAD